MIDRSPCVVAGAISMPRARVIWLDGVLYLFTSQTRWQHVRCDDEPRQQVRGTFVADTELGTIRFRKSGCSCGCGVCRVKRQKLLASVGVSETV